TRQIVAAILEQVVETSYKFEYPLPALFIDLLDLFLCEAGGFFDGLASEVHQHARKLILQADVRIHERASFVQDVDNLVLVQTEDRRHQIFGLMRAIEERRKLRLDPDPGIQREVPALLRHFE